MQGPILIARFKSLRILELKKIPTHMLEGLHKLRGQLQIVTVTRCLHNLQVSYLTLHHDFNQTPCKNECLCSKTSIDDQE